MSRTIELLEPSGAATVVPADVNGGDLWLSKADLAAVTGFELKPEGLCRGELCYPLPPGREAEFARGNEVNIAAFWRYRGGAVIHSRDGDAWVLGDALDEQRARLDSLEAPDFTLPDLSGELHSLSDYRGRKVLLAAWASW
jgi:hypothetical protein